ncbi:hypothetical protein EDC15_110101 [Acetobacter aceti NBRC 14818]|uniref:Uncharacterized protein n=1 Tax=Acetobacter aceti NBRC 14818 TaxID=887700 RepID=A0AB33I7G5_ACEAC|nr:hypothetical protein [Acetobacter aceti]TCS32876.1 hypothetical protein EDC15_110101 [Acetobacter aceti NBRC 14818]BCK74710.1 hypothetical protein EMQ_0316 [Acetobacter aceti NBRC 14818]GAN58345.1 hypothetical protein Abac_046_011 [Acetobacter aceti NBRC 14818]
MRSLDFSSWHSALITMIGLTLLTLLGVGVRLIMMLTLQQRRERLNRQINERIRTLIAAYKTLGGSFTGDLSVSPLHLRDMKQRDGGSSDVSSLELSGSTDRARRIRDAVESALSDIILLGTEEHVRLAVKAASELVQGRNVHTHDLVVALRDFIRKALDIERIPSTLEIPRQGPSRPASSGGGREKGEGGGKGGGGGDMGGGGGGMGGVSTDSDSDASSSHHM